MREVVGFLSTWTFLDSRIPGFNNNKNLSSLNNCYRTVGGVNSPSFSWGVIFVGAAQFFVGDRFSFFRGGCSSLSGELGIQRTPGLPDFDSRARTDRVRGVQWRLARNQFLRPVPMLLEHAWLLGAGGLLVDLLLAAVVWANEAEALSSRAP